MLKNFRLNQILWLINSGLAFVISLTTVIFPSIYDDILTEDIIAGTLAQDVMTIPLAAILFYVTRRMTAEDTKQQLTGLGILAYFFYVYGIYTIERVYNYYYFFYMILFALSFYTIVFGLLSLDLEELEQTHVGKNTRRLSIVFLILIPVIFYPLWISMLWPLIQEKDRIEFLYSIFILDLCFIMPSFLISAYLCIKDHVLGYLSAPSLFVLGCTLLFPVAIAELIIPLYDRDTLWSDFFFYLILSLMFLGIGLNHLNNLRIHDNLKE